jgi:hypothetical protein
MIDTIPLPFDLPSVQRKKLTVDFDGGNQSSDGGLLLLRQAERKLGVCRRLADAMPDRRDPSRICHDMFEMVMARVSAIACGHEDAIDLDRLRHDPLMKLAVGHCPDSGAALASQSTISRLENAPSKEAVPDDHPVRAIAGVLDLSWVRSKLVAYYSDFGRPSIDPVLMIRQAACWVSRTSRISLRRFYSRSRLLASLSQIFP